MPSVKARMDFLQAVVSGRGTRSQRFNDWFPDFSKGNLGSVINYWSFLMKLPFWRNQNVPRFSPTADERQTYEAGLRHALRVIWHRAIASDSPQAPVARLRVEIREFQHVVRGVRKGTEAKPGFTGWVTKTEYALVWLEHNTHKLRLCGIADCRQFPYFIATPSRKKYCSADCQREAEDQRSLDHYKRTVEAKDVAALGGQGTKKPRLSPEGSERISKAAKAMWKKRRRGKGRSKND